MKCKRKKQNVLLLSEAKYSVRYLLLLAFQFYLGVVQMWYEQLAHAWTNHCT